MAVDGRISTIQVLLAQISHCLAVLKSRPLDKQEKKCMTKVVKDICNDIKTEVNLVKQEIDQV